MIQIIPNALYTRSDLAELLAPAGVDVDHFISRLKPRKFLRKVWLGEDILAAMRQAPDLDAPIASVVPTIPSVPPAPPRRKRRGDPCAPLDAYLETLKG